MDFTRERVSLADIRPSKENPRSEFGDIDALADSIRATGNEPVNPPVVVRDGNVYRIVDGERRYRALREVWKREPGHEVTVLVAGDLDAANELVAMLATDDKRQLTEAERARGVQQMLVLIFFLGCHTAADMALGLVDIENVTRLCGKLRVYSKQPVSIRDILVHSGFADAKLLCSLTHRGIVFNYVVGDFHRPCLNI